MLISFVYLSKSFGSLFIFDNFRVLVVMAPPSVPNMDEATIRAATLPVKRTATHIYFFGYEGTDPEVCFQQWYPSNFEDKDLAGSPRFPTSEHYMMYRKALLFGDKAVAEKILAAETPGEAKTLGRQAGYVDYTSKFWICGRQVSMDLELAVNI